MPLLNGGGRSAALERLQGEARAADLTALLRKHGLAAAVRAPIEAHDLWGQLPALVAEVVRDASRRQRVLAVQSLECMSELGAALERCGVRYLFLKGPLLSHRIYGELEARSVGDVDLMVEPGAVEVSAAMLRRIGFEPHFGILGSRRLSRAFTHHFAFARGSRIVELHWLPLREAGVRLDLKSLWERVELVEVRGSRYPVPDLESSLPLQISTVAKDLELGYFRLRSAVDVLRLLEALERRQDAGPAAAWSERLVWLDAQGLARLAPVVLELVLRLLEVGGRFPELERELARRRNVPARRGSAIPGLRVFDCHPPAWRNKRALFRLHRGGSLPTWCWWALSLVWRRRVYTA